MVTAICSWFSLFPGTELMSLLPLRHDFLVVSASARGSLEVHKTPNRVPGWQLTAAASAPWRPPGAAGQQQPAVASGLFIHGDIFTSHPGRATGRAPEGGYNLYDRSFRLFSAFLLSFFPL